MYYNFMSFVIEKLKTHNNLIDENFLPINEVVSKINDFKIRPAITYGNNTDWSNIRRDEDWILTFQVFVNHNNYLDLRLLCDEFRKTIIKYCCSVKINDVLYSVNNVTFTSQYESDYRSMSILIYVNTKETF